MPIAVLRLRRALAWLCVLWLSLWALPLSAQSRAYFDRDRVALDQTVNLTIEVEGMQSPPEFSNFIRDFQIVNFVTQPQVNMSSAGLQVRVAVILQLQPTREGWIEVPAFRVGSEMLGPLRIFVAPPVNPPSPVPQPLPVGPQSTMPAVMLQSSIDPGPVYVQQSVGYVMRLYYESSRLLDGRLEQPPPVGASLLRVGEDIETDRIIDGRTFRVVERRFLLVPNRPGRVQVPGPKFEGNSLVSIFDEMLGGGSKRNTLQVTGDARTLQALPIPANAPQPWLPVRNLRLRYLNADRSARVGEATKVTVELVMDGANAVLLPELQVQVDGDAQLFAEAAQVSEDFAGDRPRAAAVREFSVVPGKPGALRIVGPRIAWWDVQAGVARTASLPDLRLDVAPAVSGASSAAGSVPTPADDTAQDSAADGPWWKRLSGGMAGSAAIAVLAVLWLITLIWAWQLWAQRRRRSARAARLPAADGAARGYDAFAYKRLFDNGSLAEISAALCAMAQPAANDLDRLRRLLDDPAQRAAIDALQRARWGDGGVIEARAQLRAAFADGPRWRRRRGAQTPAMLPPLYPET
jgi:cbb3-type cytochrome oxidase subunit 3